MQAKNTRIEILLRNGWMVVKMLGEIVIEKDDEIWKATRDDLSFSNQQETTILAKRASCILIEVEVK